MPSFRSATVLWLSCLVLALSSFALPVYAQDAAPAPAHADAGRATVVIYRVPSMKSAVWKHGVYLDKTLVVKLSSGGFTRLSLAPGEYLLSTGTRRNPTQLSVTLKLDAGETHYVAYEVGRDLYTPDNLRFVSARTGAAALDSGDYRYQAPLAAETTVTTP